MINIIDKVKCCGCGSCEQACPKACITLTGDAEGFPYPMIDNHLCIDCGICEQVCPELHQHKSRLPIKVLAAQNQNEKIRLESSSGGIFTSLAEQIIADGGIVFGACFNKTWEVEHCWTDNYDGLKKFRGSKYVQSHIGKSFKEAKSFLKDGREVLFSGTPCQIAGLKQYLRKDYDNLYTIDFICHGVPSPMVWRKYLQEEIARQCEKNTVSHSAISTKDALIKGICHRDKSNGWKKYSFALQLSVPTGNGENSVSLCINANENPFLKGFLCDLYLRPSCHHCAFRCGRSGSDLTIADLWGCQEVYPQMNDNKGTSAIYMYNERMPKSLSWNVAEIPFENAISHNPSWLKSTLRRQNRDLFFKTLQSNPDIPIIPLILKYAPFSFWERLKRYIIRRIFKQ